MKPGLSLPHWLAAHQRSLHRAAVRTGHRAVSWQQGGRLENWPDFQLLPTIQLNQQKRQRMYEHIKLYGTEYCPQLKNCN